MTAQPCGGCVEFDAAGKFIRRFACEVHLFDEAWGTCRWERKRREEREAKQ